MGRQMDLENMLGLPAEIVCPYCRKLTDTNLCDIDMDCESVNPEPGTIVGSGTCSECERQFRVTCVLSITETKVEQVND